jgi:hypothetical protein
MRSSGSFYADGIPAVKADVSTIPLIRETHKRLTINQKPLCCCAVRPQWMTFRALRARLQKFDYRPTAAGQNATNKAKNQQIRPSVTHVHTTATCFFWPNEWRSLLVSQGGHWDRSAMIDLAGRCGLFFPGIMRPSRVSVVYRTAVIVIQSGSWAD